MTTVRVLLVDDYPAFLERARRLLSQFTGVAVVGTARSGEEAVALAEQLRPDLILLDYQMPGMNGLETARRLKAQDPSVPVVIVTVHDDAARRAAAERAGADGWLGKTSLADGLAPLIERLIGREAGS